MGLFNKKKKSVDEETDLKVNNKAENGTEKIKPKKDGALGRIKKKIHLKITFKKKDAADSGEQSDPTKDVDEKPAKAKKPKKEKKPKAPKVKKAKKEKKPKKKKEGDSESGDKKKKPILLIIIIGGALLAGGAAFGIVTFLKRPTVPQLLIEASTLMIEEKYPEARAIYEKLVEKDPSLPEAQIGLADTYAKENDLDTALLKLNDALEPTGQNEQVLEKIKELTPVPESGSASPGTTAIMWQDPVFEKMLRKALNKTDSEPLTESDLTSVTTLSILGETHAVINDSLRQHSKVDGYEIDNELYTEHGSIKNLNDLVHFKKLRRLTIGYNSISDISGVASLQSLEMLSLYFNNISDISAMSSLANLKELYIYGNNITDLSPLAGLTNLQTVWLNRNKISDISALKDLNQLVELFINDNEVVDISPIKNLTSLNFFYANNNLIEDISVVENMPSLTDVSFIGNPVTDLSPASKIRRVNKPWNSIAIHK